MKGGINMDYFSQEKTATEEATNGQFNTATEALDVPNLVRSNNSGDKIYFVKDGTKHWVTSPEVLKALGFDFGQEKEIDRTVMAGLQSGEPIRIQNVNEYILPLEEEPQETPIVEAEVVEPMQEVDNTRIEGYISIIVPCILTVDSVEKLLAYISNLQRYFSGEIITVVVNKVDYKNYSPKFGNKVIECEDIDEGIERARRVAKGEAIECDLR